MPGAEQASATLAWTLLLLSAAAVLGLAILLGGLARVFARAPRLAVLSKSDEQAPPPEGSLTVVVPAYNEAANIGPCLSGLLASEPPCSRWRVLLVDDGSSDDTLVIGRQAAAQALAEAAAPAESFGVLDAGPRPAGERWVGKTWPCSRAMEQVDSDWVLFLDADVRLQPVALRRALAQAVAEGADLLSLAPRLSCGCLAEWMVQPLMLSLLGLGFPIEAANDPASPVAFAAGPFMLFRRSAYEAIGGHRAVAGEVVEDLALARRIKESGHSLRYLLGLDAADLRMYADFPALWEGWTKNWLLGLDGNVPAALGAAAVVALMFSAPWLLAPAAAIAALLLPAERGPLLTALALAVLGIGLQLALRLWMQRQFALPLRHWWLMGAGGLVVAAIGPTSVWRTRTGRGWTWKGRPLE
ncbi:MAG: glycosyltransferase family 2 protein [Prochlorococcaceae cyanobacterium]